MHFSVSARNEYKWVDIIAAKLNCKLNREALHNAHSSDYVVNIFVQYM